MKLRPLKDQIIVKRKEEVEVSRGGIFLAPTTREKPSEGEVLNVGPGRTLDNGTVIVPSVKPGDVVLFNKHSGTEVVLDDETFIVMREDHILGVYEKE